MLSVAAVAEEVSGLTHSQRVARLRARHRRSDRHEAHSCPALRRVRFGRAERAEPALLPDDEGELTDEEAFYLAQEESFAEMRARYQARPRRKL